MKILKTFIYGGDSGKKVDIDPERQSVDSSDINNNNYTNGAPTVGHNHALRSTNGEVILGRLPSQGRGTKLKEVRKANRYLSYQEARIKKAVTEGNFDKATLIWCSILHRSLAYQIGLLNRTIYGWYWKLSSKDLSETVYSAVAALRRWNLKLLINRFYILKKNGKYRPIGAPSPTSKIITKCFTDMVSYYSTKDRHDMQHGYRPHLGTHSALWKALEKIKEGYNIYEFDFKSYFNTVSLSSVFKTIGKYGPHLAYTVTNMIATDTVKTKNGFKEEKEYTKIEGSLYKKQGMPQGLSLSPILATLVLESKITPDNLVMYADDGLYFFKDGEKNQFNKWIDSLYWFGIKIEPEKSGTVIGPKLKFLGVEFNLSEQTLSYDGSRISWADNTDEVIQTWLKQVAQWYGKEKKGWTWAIEPTSMITTIKPKMGFLLRLWIMIYCVWTAKSWKGYRYFLGLGIYDVVASSSISCDKLLYNLKKHSGILPAYKCLKLAEKGAFSPGPHHRKGYDFKIEHIWPPNYQPWKVKK
jgi:hypothetical protein